MTSRVKKLHLYFSKEEMSRDMEHCYGLYDRCYAYTPSVTRQTDGSCLIVASSSYRCEILNSLPDIPELLKVQSIAFSALVFKFLSLRLQLRVASRR